MIGAAILVALATGASMIYPRVTHWLAMRAGIRKVNAWYQQARTCVIPAGTLLYSENPADFPNGHAFSSRSAGQTRTFVYFSSNFPLLTRVGYGPDGVPVLFDAEVLFVHERATWAVPRGTKPCVVIVGYQGHDPGGRLIFDTMIFDIGNGKPPFPSMGAGSIMQQLPDRPMTNLRIFAGSADPNDPTRFSLPFQSDGGSGKFELQMDDDVSDGGRLSPEVWIVWDTPAPTPAPAGD